MTTIQILMLVSNIISKLYRRIDLILVDNNYHVITHNWLKFELPTESLATSIIHMARYQPNCHVCIPIPSSRKVNVLRLTPLNDRYTPGSKICSALMSPYAQVLVYLWVSPLMAELSLFKKN